MKDDLNHSHAVNRARPQEYAHASRTHHTRPEQFRPDLSGGAYVAGDAVHAGGCHV